MNSNFQNLIIFTSILFERMARRRLLILLISMIVQYNDAVSMPTKSPCFDFVIEKPVAKGEMKFPLTDFLNATGITTSVKWEGFQCNKWINEGECSCTKDCQKTSSCCIDFLWKDFAFNNKTLAENVGDYLKAVFTSTKRQSCIPLFPFNNDLSDRYYIMVDSCLPDANETDVKMCSESSSNLRNNQIPVYGDDDFLYKNKYCARCNQILSYRNDTFIIDCSNPRPSINQNDTLIDILRQNKEDCRIAVRGDYHRHILNCKQNVCDRNEATLCRLFRGDFVVDGYDDWYYESKNIFCQKCKEWSLSNGKISKPCGRRGFSPAWSKVISLVDLVKETECEPDEREVSFGVCVKIKCDEGQQPFNGICINPSRFNNKSNTSYWNNATNFINSNTVYILGLKKSMMRNTIFHWLGLHLACCLTWLV